MEVVPQEEKLHCLIHICDSVEEECKSFTKKRWETLQQAATVWFELTGQCKTVAEKLQPFLARFTDKKRLSSARKRTIESTTGATTTTTPDISLQQNNSYVVPPKLLRSDGIVCCKEKPGRVLPVLCIICKKKEKYVTVRNKREFDRLLKAETKTGGKLLHCAETKQDESILLHLRGTDCVAAETRYHLSCYKSYTRSAYSNKENHRSRPSQFDEAYAVLCTNVIEERIINNEEILRLSKLVQILLKTLQDHNVDIDYLRSDLLKYWLSRDYPQLSFQSSKRKNDSAFVFSEYSSHMIERLHDISGVLSEDSTTDDEYDNYDNFEMDPSRESTHTLYKASLILKRVISQSNGLTCPWPPKASDITIDTARSVVPMELFNFLSWSIGASQEPTLQTKVNIPENIERKVLSICQDIIYLESNGRKQTPKSLCLGMTIRHLSGSSRLIDIINHLGHCASTDSIIRLDTSLAELQLLKGINSVPCGFQKSIPTILVWDNIDFREETPTGYGTTHHTNGIMIQSKISSHTTEDKEDGSQITVGKRKRQFQPQPSIILPYHRKSKHGPVSQALPTNTPLEISHYKSTLEKVNLLDLAFVGLRFKDKKVPGWTGFNTLLQDDQPEKSAIHYLPVIEASPTELSTVNTILKQSCEISRSLNLDHIVVVFDESIYAKAQEIRWSNPQMEKQLVIRLGEFHICMSFMGIIGKRFRDAGLRDLIIESGVVAEGSVNKVLDGHHYNRSLRAHKLIYEALQRLRMETFLASLTPKQRQEAQNCLADLVAAFHSSSFKPKVKSLKISAFSTAYNHFVKCKSEQNPTFQLWSSYIEMVSLLLHFIRATRESDWELHLATVRCLLPWFFAYDHLHYARYLPAYWIEMISLPITHPKCNEEMIAGLWTVQRQDHHSFSAIACDQAIEQTCNRDSKTKGGITGLTRHPGAVQRWILSQPDRSAITRQCEVMAGTSTENRKRKDLDPARTAKDDATVQKVIDTTNSMINHFDGKHDDLICISSGVVAPANVKNDLLQAGELGEKLAVSFIDDRLVSNTSDIHAKLSQQKSKTCTSIQVKKVQTKEGKHVTIQNDRNIFARLLVIGQRREVDLRKVLSYSLGCVSFPLATSTGGFAKTDKSIMKKIIKEKLPTHCPDANISEGVALIIDGMAVIQSLSTTAATFGEYANLVLSIILKLAHQLKANRVDFVCDRYLHCSIKDPERKRRGCSNSQEITIYGRDQKMPTQWKKFLASGKNKESLLRFLYNFWSDKSFENSIQVDIPVFFTSGAKCSCLTTVDANLLVREIKELNCDHEEADTRLLLHAKHASVNCSDIVIKSPDTDVLVLMCGLASSISANLYFMCGTNSQTEVIEINTVLSSLGKDMCEALIGLHCFTGCDSTSAFFGKGKRKAFEVLESDKEFIDSFSKFGKKFDFPEHLLPTCEKCVCKLYGQNVNNINDARYRLFCLSKFSEQNLPPTEDALLQHCKRVNYQVAVWKQALVCFMKAPLPEGHGWEVKNGELSVKWMLKPPAPETVLNFVHCKCKTSQCASKKCSCRAVDLKCTELCQCTSCENSNMTPGNSESESEESEEEL